MSSIGTLYSVPTSGSTKRILGAAALGGLKIDLAKDYVHFETNKTPEFIAKFASGKIPAFEDNDGFTLFETIAIARYVSSLAPNSTLLGSSAKEAAKVDQWVSFSALEIGSHLGALALFLSEKVPYNKAIDNHHREAIKRGLSVIEHHLSTRTYLVGERISLADLSVAATYQIGYHYILDAAFRASHPNTLRWFNTIVNHPKLAPIYGPTDFVEKAKQFTPTPKKKEEKPKAEEKKKEDKPKAAKKEVEADDDDDEPLVPEEPKAKNPLDSLPKSTFNLEDWKRAYSNLDTRGAGGSIEWFNEKFDPEGFSVWKVTFKFNEELTQTFMSSNQIGGFYNRLEASRKYLFGSMGVLGTNNDSIITGVFILRGPASEPVVSVAPDWESYTYEKIDYKEGDGKAFFDAALAWDLVVDGRKWVDGKAFK